MNTHTNDNGETYFSTTTDKGETIFSFTQDFTDYWSKDEQDLHENRTYTIMKDTQIPVRYFAYDFDDEEVELVEVDQQTFDSLEGKVTTERHTMFTNGCNQVCHTKANY